MSSVNFRTGTILTKLLLLSLLAGGCANAAERIFKARKTSDSPSLSSQVNGTTTTCNAWATISLNDTLLNNNTWGVIDDVEGTQCVSTIDAKHYAWKWNWSNRTDHVITYPSITYGFKPWGRTSTTPNLPRVVSRISSIPISFRFDQVATGRQNLLLEAWLTEPGTLVSNNTIQREVGIHFFQNGWSGQAGDRVGQVTIDSVDYEVYFTKPWQSDRAEFHWEYVSFVRVIPIDTPADIQIDFKNFLDALISLNLSSEDLQLASLELGTEIVSGSGRALVSNLNIAVH